jgi:23S rRNA (uracil1939-C5)-methyltransferase
MLREDRDGALHVLVRSRGQVAWTGWRAMADHLAEARIAATVWWHPAEGAPRAMGGLRGASPATVFEQVHPAMGDRVRAHAIEQLGSIAGLHLWDLYAGIGETTDRLAAAGATVESVEVESRAVECAERRWRSRMQQHAESQRPAPTGVVHHAGRVEEVIHHLRRPDAVVANPPRGGLGPGVVAEIAVRRPGRVVYVSCDPATLARDLKLLCAPGGPYRLVAVQPFDLFPQTAHVETVAALELT